MKPPNPVCRLFLILFLTLFSATLLAQQNKSDNGYIPEVGQKGKDVVWVPTPPELVDVMLNKLAKVTPDDYVIDLGSGDGRLVIAAAKLGAQAVGIEYNPDMVALSKRNARQEGVSDKADFFQADLFECDLSKATVITMFLLPEINLKLRPRLLELKPGTRIVSNTFTMGEWEPDYEITTEENWNSWNTALLWIVPAKVNGAWKIGKDDLLIKQEFQMIYGTLTFNGKTTSISDGRLNGNDLTFRVGDALYIGKTDGATMIGTVTTSDTKSDWYATR
jgi:precorrin-6B methylase 2